MRTWILFGLALGLLTGCPEEKKDASKDSATAKAADTAAAKPTASASAKPAGGGW